MSLARTLGMTRRRLLSEVDSYELEMWAIYFREANKPQQKKQSPEELACQLKNVFAAKKAKDKGKAKK